MGAVCDPIDDPASYLRAAEESGMRIRFVIDTHVHADHISGGRKLAEMTGAQYVLHGDCGARYEFFPVEDGDNLDLGNVQDFRPARSNQNAGDAGKAATARSARDASGPDLDQHATAYLP